LDNGMEILHTEEIGADRIDPSVKVMVYAHSKTKRA